MILIRLKFEINIPEQTIYVRSLVSFVTATLFYCDGLDDKEEIEKVETNQYKVSGYMYKRRIQSGHFIRQLLRGQSKGF